ncbi:galactosyl transferase [Mesorhizobium xinjiangense]|uniref:galactosyl transferase n=1 Tax=Mesorhizobium xinjiangense TaxID=2678685 RepID=UPI0012EDA7B5|nr:galactosyl transferase [Mesorhizobium xinjiangense]
MTLLTFIVPVRHQDNARDWDLLRTNLAQTVRSISNQTNGDWRGLVVANQGADLPDLPDGFDVVRVDFPPNDMHEMGAASLDEVYEAFRADKGRRVLMGMLAAPDSRYFMIVDDDDFVSSRIVQHVADDPEANGWTIERGYIWDDGGKILLEYDGFDRVCGTSLIVRADLYGVPDRFEDASLDWIKSMLGSHVRIADILAERGTPLAALPFPGAVYRVAHKGSHSQAPSLLVKYFLSREAMKRPRRLLRNLGRLRLIGQAQEREFFGKAA